MYILNMIHGHKTGCVIKPISFSESDLAVRPSKVSSEIVTLKINEGRAHLYFYGTECRPVLSITSSRLKTRLGSYRFHMDPVEVPRGVSRQKFASQYRETVVEFVKSRLRKAASSSDVKKVLIEEPEVVEASVVVEAVSDAVEVVTASLPVASEIVSGAAEEVTTSLPVVSEAVVESETIKKRTLPGVTLVDFGYRDFPYGEKDKTPPIVFCAVFRGSSGKSDITLWGDDLRRAIVTCNAEKGSVVDVTDLGRSTIENPDGSITKKRKLYEMTLVSI
jgi:hypothetical protein